ncbi:MAG TPA: protein kinase, partial [Pyrinomonadaceae bacterium]|nr:protein kinase [Pyrinomonadaceae bacterium]
MKAERWQRVEQLYHSTLEKEVSERASFLAEACAGDEGLRREVESLLEYEDGAKDFIESPALQMAAKLMADEDGATVVRQSVNQYRIISPLGAGGMGEVYLAEDTRLERRVALKFLPGLFTRDKGHMRRFEQEARAVAALSHPNVCVIHEVVETAEGDTCIVMEYVEGVTLRERLAKGPMKVGEALNAAIQAASALSAAHAAGIVHRDIKLENIMLRRDGYAKVLDFGLAKLTETPPATGSGEPTQELINTTPGMVLGTVSYMSPEQARGLPVDTRSDVWSLGVVLYELVTGRQPFQGATPTDVIISIAEREPAPLTKYASEVPTGLQEIVTKALTKDRDQRYQTAEHLLTDLKSLQRELEIGIEVARYNQPKPGGASMVTTSNRQADTSQFFPLRFTRSRILILTAVIAMLVIAGLVSTRVFRQSSTPLPQTEIKSFAVLPLKSLDPNSAPDYLGLGIADTIITKVSQAGGLTVRPTSAVRKYADQEIDSLEAARQLNVDAVLDGTFLHAGDRLRVNVNLLRVRDGASIWAEKFDMRFTDIFTIQDDVSREVAARLQLKLSPTEQTRLAKRHTANPDAYGYYTKAMYYFSDRRFSGEAQDETDTAIELLKKAIELDPNYALAHAQLGYAYAWLADFKEAGPGLIASAKEELSVAERLDPQLPEVHVARCFILWSHFEGWQTEAAIREARYAKQLDPSIANQVLAAIYYHIGLEELSIREYESALEQDPTSDTIKRSYLFLFSQLARPDEWLVLNQKLYDRGADVNYYLEKRMLQEAAPLVEQEILQSPDEPRSRRYKAVLLALQGKHSDAQAA